MITLLKYWQLIIGAALALLTIYVVHTYDSAIYKVDKENALTEQRNAATAQCEKDKAKTKEANDALRDNRNAIAKQLTALKLQHPARCIPITGHAIIRTNTGTDAKENGLSTEWLYDYAAEAQGYQDELGVCVSFLRSERGLQPL